jgi:hypothetical protein
MINGDLTKLDRKKLITLCTIDVHARDVVQRLIDERVEGATAFQWQSQLRYVVSEKTKATQVGGCWVGVGGWVCSGICLLVLVASLSLTSALNPSGTRPRNLQIKPKPTETNPQPNRRPGQHLRRRDRVQLRVHRQLRRAVHHAADGPLLHHADAGTAADAGRRAGGAGGWVLECGGGCGCSF